MTICLKCKKRAYFNYKYEIKSSYCSNHKLNNMNYH